MSESLEGKRKQLERLLPSSSVVEARESREYYEFKVRVPKKVDRRLSRKMKKIWARQDHEVPY